MDISRNGRERRYTDKNYVGINKKDNAMKQIAKTIKVGE